MAKYLLLIYGNEERWDTISAADMNQIDAGHRAFAAEAGAAILGSGQLEPSNQARTLRTRQGGAKPAITDGPFIETKEVVGGYYVVEAATMERALTLAGLLAETRQDHSGVQVHPLVNHG